MCVGLLMYSYSTRFNKYEILLTTNDTQINYYIKTLLHNTEQSTNN